jgi:hypothetical protein
MHIREHQDVFRQLKRPKDERKEVRKLENIGRPTCVVVLCITQKVKKGEEKLASPIV